MAPSVFQGLSQPPMLGTIKETVSLSPPKGGLLEVEIVAPAPQALSPPLPPVNPPKNRRRKTTTALGSESKSTPPVPAQLGNLPGQSDLDLLLSLHKQGKYKSQSSLHLDTNKAQDVSKRRNTIVGGQGSSEWRDRPTRAKPQTRTEFMEAVVRGDQLRVEGLLKMHPHLVHYRATVEDPAGRKFRRITGFQYCLWARDWHMWGLFLEPGRLTAAQAAQQLRGLEDEGSAHGFSADLYGILADYNKFLMDHHWLSFDVTESQAKEMDKAWIKVIGGAQKKMPVHILQEMCHPSRPLFPIPDFTTRSLDRIRSLNCDESLNLLDAEYNDGRLGETFAIVRSSTLSEPLCVRSMRVGKAGVVPRPLDDFRALTRLVEVRQRQYNELKERLFAAQDLDGAIPHDLPKRQPRLTGNFVDASSSFTDSFGDVKADCEREIQDAGSGSDSDDGEFKYGLPVRREVTAFTPDRLTSNPANSPMGPILPPTAEKALTEGIPAEPRMIVDSKPAVTTGDIRPGTSAARSRRRVPFKKTNFNFF